MRRILMILLGCAILGAAFGWVVTGPDPLDPSYGAGLTPDAEAGALVFAAGGCVSCHAAPKSEGDKMLVLTGGLPFPSDFGTFHAPNISPDSNHGIGGWTLPQFTRAVTRGVSPEGQHYYPAFPYAAYQHLAPQDVVNLFAYMQTLPAAEVPSLPHEVGYPFNVRRGLGVWKMLFLKDEYVMSDVSGAQVERGRYLVEGMAHCGECHTARNALGGLQRKAWLTGAPNPSGKGRIPGITPAHLDWSQADLVEYFTSGFTPEYDSAGGEMAEVVRNLAQLPESDREAIAAYLKALPGG